MLCPSTTIPDGVRPTGNVPNVEPSDAVNLVTELLSLFVIQTVKPSNAIASAPADLELAKIFSIAGPDFCNTSTCKVVYPNIGSVKSNASRFFPSEEGGQNLAGYRPQFSNGVAESVGRICLHRRRQCRLGYCQLRMFQQRRHLAHGFYSLNCFQNWRSKCPYHRTPWQ